MTFIVQLTRWRKGVKVVSLVELYREATGSSLSASKAAIDGFLNGTVIEIPFETSDVANEFVKRVELLGVEGKTRVRRT